MIVNSQYRLEPGKSLYQEEFRELLKSALDLSAAGGFQFITLSGIFSAAVLNDKTIQRIFLILASGKKMSCRWLIGKKDILTSIWPKTFLV